MGKMRAISGTEQHPLAQPSVKKIKGLDMQVFFKENDRCCRNNPENKSNVRVIKIDNLKESLDKLRAFYSMFIIKYRLMR